MHDLPLLLNIAVALSYALAGGVIATRLGLPPIVGYLIAGGAIGPATPVFVHGDLCLPNILVENGALSGIVDWGRAGFGDPFQDLALAVRSLTHNLGPSDWDRRLADACGLPELDPGRLGLWCDFDELF